jgi:hypothetical protein
MMKYLKIAAAVVFGLWMVWVSLQLIQIRAVALEACGLAATGGENSQGAIRLPVVCPDLAVNEVK